MKYLLIILAILLTLALSGNAQAPSSKSFNSHGDCHDPPGENSELCLAIYNVKGYGICTFMLSDGYYSGSITLVGCK